MRRLAAARAVYGAVLVVASGSIVERVTGERSSRAAAIGRVLGMRHLLQTLVLGRARSAKWLNAGAGVDVLHALSMALVAGLSEKYRRLAVIDAVVAGTWAESGWLTRHRSEEE